MAEPTPPAPVQEKPKRILANENPWYLLATLHGEQSEGADVLNFDGDLHAKNCLAWNRYMATIAETETLEAASTLKKADGLPRIPPEELRPFDDEERAQLLKQFRARGGRELLQGEIDFRQTDFVRQASFDGFWLAKDTSFDKATFSGLAGFGSATFSGVAGFQSATFSREAWFQSATFSEETWFLSATFSAEASFVSAVFSRNA